MFARRTELPWTGSSHITPENGLRSKALFNYLLFILAGTRTGVPLKTRTKTIERSGAKSDTPRYPMLCEQTKEGGSSISSHSISANQARLHQENWSFTFFHPEYKEMLLPYAR
jgi:hypothetical protein